MYIVEINVSTLPLSPSSTYTCVLNLDLFLVLEINFPQVTPLLNLNN